MIRRSGTKLLCSVTSQVFALHTVFGEKVYMFSLSLNTHEKAESKQTVPTVYVRKSFLFIIMNS